MRKKKMEGVCPEREELCIHTNTGGLLGFSRFGKNQAACSIVMDFDLTISSIHVWNTLARTGDISAGRIPRDLSPEQIFGGRSRLRELEGLFSALEAKGVQICILTNNYSDVVQKCMEAANLDRFVPDIIGREQPGTKGQIVARLRDSLSASAQDQWIFVDDDPHNVRNVHLATQGGVVTVLIDGGLGMQRDHFQKILSMVA
eukprot:TRINITY_DN19320_c0_g1_i1.p1 TRINITY_DN19320_c0_g1~~TRINITY_DN19320_c0_g1_i1.p1  ORF type:complete len:202 (+),score=23.52 TRINITY_DN19320_c0_g1_i1:1-606(+)